MKKKIIILLSLLVLINLTGCYKEYSGEYSNLYTVAINSVLWTNGYSFSADRYKNSDIEIIDEDQYGRIMFTYYERYYSGGDISFSSLVVCQYSNEKEVFYYEDINYIVKEQPFFAVEPFTDEEIEQLKVVNDWNQEINYDKCIKKEITKSKPNIPYQNEIESKIVDEFHLGNERYHLFVDFLTRDSDNANFIIYGYIYRGRDPGPFFIGLVENNQESLGKISFLVPQNVYDYKTEFIEFKQINNWK